MSNFVARGRKLARLTPEEEHAWDFAWTFYEDEYPDENIRAGVVWRDLQMEFPRLRKFEGTLPDVAEASGITDAQITNRINELEKEEDSLDFEMVELHNEIAKGDLTSIQRENKLNKLNFLIGRTESIRLEKNHLKSGLASGRFKEGDIVQDETGGKFKILSISDKGVALKGIGERHFVEVNIKRKTFDEQYKASGRKAKFGISYGKDKRMIWKVNNKVASFSSEGDANSVIQEMIPRFKYHNPRVIKLDEEQTEDAVELGDTALLIV